MMEDNKVYFMPGDIVTLRQDITNKPQTMYVVGKKTRTIKLDKGSDKEEFFKGIICRWFSSTGELQEAIFNTKDLVKL